MAILNIITSQAGQVGLAPKWIYIATNNTLAEVTATGFLNQSVQNGTVLHEDDMALVSIKTSPSATSTQVAILELSHSPTTGWSLVSTGGPGNVTLPTIANHIATYTNTLGALSEDPATAISGGNLQAGLSGTAGYLASFPSTASRGSLRLTAVANTGNTVTTISNAAMGQASTISIPDPGASTANFLLSASPTPQTVTGGFTVSTGNLIVSAGTITSSGNITSTGGLVQSGQSGTAGSLVVYPPAATNGHFVINAGNAGSDFTTVLTTGTMGQGTTFTLPDPGATTANLIVSKSASTQHITVGSLQVDAGQITSGLTSGGTTGGFRAYPSTASKGSLVLSPVSASIGDFDTVISNGVMGQTTVYTIPDIGAATGGFVVAPSGVIMKAGTQGIGAGSATVTITDAFCTTTAVVIPVCRSQVNPAVIRTVNPGTGSFDITFDADPGLGEVRYVIYR